MIRVVVYIDADLPPFDSTLVDSARRFVLVAAMKHPDVVNAMGSRTSHDTTVEPITSDHFTLRILTKGFAPLPPDPKEKARQYHIKTFTQLIAKADQFKFDLWSQNYHHGDNSFVCEQSAVFAIGNVPVQIGRWTSVGERMPPEDSVDEYLVYDVEQDAIQVAGWDGAEFIHLYNGLDSITHWMPKPGRPPVNLTKEDDT